MIIYLMCIVSSRVNLPLFLLFLATLPLASPSDTPLALPALSQLPIPAWIAHPGLRQQPAPLNTPSVGSNTPIFLEQKQYIGSYENNAPTPLFDYLVSESGSIQVLLFRNQLNNPTGDIDTFEMVLFDPVYHDGRAVRVMVSLGKMASKSEWNATDAKAQVTKYWKQRTDGSNNISNVAYSIRLLNIQTQDASQVRMQIDFSSPEFKFTANVNYDNAKLSTMGYCMYTSAVVLIQIVSAFYLLKRMDLANPNIISKMSLTTVAVCNIQDFYLTMVHIEYIMTSGSATYLFYIVPSICYIMLFVVFDMKLLFLVWRSHYMREIDNPQALRKKLTTFYIKFYLGLFVYLILTYFCSFDAWMIILQNLFMLPQIVYNARIGNNPGFEPLYVLGYMCARFLVPLYERGCPSNHFMLSPIVGLVVALLILYALQAAILLMQSKIGPRFFIPKIFQPDYYNYNFKMGPSEQNRQLECSICLQNFFHEPTEDTQAINAELEQPIFKEKNVMRTPCNHFFHKDCLASWADVKLECPSCRAHLPPL